MRRLQFLTVLAAQGRVPSWRVRSSLASRGVLAPW